MSTGAIIGNHAGVIGRLFGGSAAVSNSGLVFDRFLPIWSGPADDPRPIQVLYDALNDFAEQFNRRGLAPECRALLDEHHGRLRAAAEYQAAVHSDYRVQCRLASGLGTEHPVGNGFSFDTLLGLPCITGSAVKGLCRRSAVLSGADRDRIDHLLGPDSGDHASCGDLIFYDALPSVWPSLIVDIINCHHPRYYGDLSGWTEDNDDPLPIPTEIESPVPVYFLAVSAKSELRFSIGSKANDRKRQEEEVALGGRWLKDGLELLGIGAKTAVGYGAMESSSGSEIGGRHERIRWRGVLLRYNKGPQEISADHDGKHATVSGKDAKPLLDDLSSAARKKLDRKKLTATINVEHQGSKRWKILKIAPD